MMQGGDRHTEHVTVNAIPANPLQFPLLAETTRPAAI